MLAPSSSRELVEPSRSSRSDNWGDKPNERKLPSYLEKCPPLEIRPVGPPSFKLSGRRETTDIPDFIPEPPVLPE
jgi:hypothetical protein